MKDKKYVPSGVDLVAGKSIRNIRVWNRHGVEQIIIASNILNKAPFKWIGLMYRYGLRSYLIPEYDRIEIDPKDGEIAIAIELKRDILEWADEYNYKLLHDIHMIGALHAIIHVAKKYKLSPQRFEEELAKYPQPIPETIAECETYPSATKSDLRFLVERFGIAVNPCRNCGHLRKTNEARYCLKCKTFSEPQTVEDIK